MSVVIVDCGGANTASLRFALARLGLDAPLTTDAGLIRAAGHVVLPGVGAADDTMRRLARCKLDEVLPELRQPVLGICLGLQILAERSAEGMCGCLGIIPGEVQRLQALPSSPVPHMGWNTVQHDNDRLFTGIGAGEFFYFVHSFVLPPGTYTTATTQYAGQSFSAAVRRNNFFAVQFHPERSGAAGAKLLQNFIALPKQLGVAA